MISNAGFSVWKPGSPRLQTTGFPEFPGRKPSQFLHGRDCFILPFSINVEPICNYFLEFVYVSTWKILKIKFPILGFVIHISKS